MINHNLEKRRQQALKVAEDCIKLLKEEFNPQEVILFGSLRGDAPWHEKSDIDIGVKGLSYQEWWRAYEIIEKIAPSWLNIDLIQLEDVPPYVRNRILQVTIMPKNRYLALKARLMDEFTALEENNQILIDLLAQSSNVPEAFVTPTLAGYTVDFYTGVERLWERIAVTLDGGLPKGENWHEQLLYQMTIIGGENRPPVFSESFLLELDNYRRFRHLVRHKYQGKLTLDKVLPLAENVPLMMEKIQAILETFNEWLESQAS